MLTIHDVWHDVTTVLSRYDSLPDTSYEMEMQGASPRRIKMAMSH